MNPGLVQIGEASLQPESPETPIDAETVIEMDLIESSQGLLMSIFEGGSVVPVEIAHLSLVGAVAVEDGAKVGGGGDVAGEEELADGGADGGNIPGLARLDHLVNYRQTLVFRKDDLVMRRGEMIGDETGVSEIRAALHADGEGVEVPYAEDTDEDAADKTAVEPPR